MATLEGHTGPVCGVALSADGRLLTSGSWDGTVRLSERVTTFECSSIDRVTYRESEAYVRCRHLGSI